MSSASEFDPVSEFLAREQEALGDLGDDFRIDESRTDIRDQPCEPTSDASYVFLNGEFKMNGSHNEQHISSDPDCAISDYNRDYNMTRSYTNSIGTESWRDEFNKRIKAKDAEEEKKCVELMENGKKELNDWYKNYHQQLETRSRELREKKSEPNGLNGQFVNGESKPSVKDSAVWESICNLCDFQSKQKIATDMSRMRGILLSLKPTP
ncbi:unnamed protein product [Heterobilharzia americana]|nr:unnamed protein product [Heterobilharzia americana]CAH8623217.1 unnamed protein product [Heterobilharzia americana]